MGKYKTNIKLKTGALDVTKYEKDKICTQFTFIGKCEG